jgi:hypothetical protein
MAADKSQDLTFSEANVDGTCFNGKNTKPVSVTSAEQIELATLLEELADIIEAEDGVLIP